MQKQGELHRLHWKKKNFIAPDAVVSGRRGAALQARYLLEMLFSAVTVHVSDLEIDAQYSVWADPRAIVYGAVSVLLLALVLLVFSTCPLTRSKNNLSGKQLLIISAFPISRRSSVPPRFRR